MDETNQQAEAPQPEQGREGGVAGFGRRHPAWTIAGLATAGLAGGIEMAAGVLLGAAVLALLRRPDSSRTTEAPAQPRGQRFDLQRLKDRAHAVMLAARGELGPPAHAG